MAESLEAKLEKYTHENIFLHKYCILKKKCDVLQQSNERIVNRIQHVKKLIKRFKKERRFLLSKLDEHGDNYRDTPVPVMWEEDQIYHLNRRTHRSPLNDSEEGAATTSKSTLAYSSLLDMTGEGPLSSAMAKLRKMKAEKKDSTCISDTDDRIPRQNAFLTFREHQKEVIRDEYYQQHCEEIPHHELTKRLTNQWESLTPEKKQVYYDMYDPLKDQSSKKFLNQETSEELARKQSEEAAVAAANILTDSVAIKEERMDT